MSAHVSSPEISYTPEHAEGTGKIWRVFWILSIITIIELIMGYGIARQWYGENHSLILAIKGAICILSFAKAFYIVGVFMHLGDEIRNFIMTIIVPLLLFVWFIIAFLWDGDSWKTLRNRYNGEPAKTEQTAPAAAEKHVKD